MGEPGQVPGETFVAQTVRSGPGGSSASQEGTGAEGTGARVPAPLGRLAGAHAGSGRVGAGWLPWPAGAALPGRCGRAPTPHREASPGTGWGVL